MSTPLERNLPITTTVIIDRNEQLDEFNTLVASICRVQGLLDQDQNYGKNRNALAFLVSATHRIEPVDWRSRLEGIRSRVADLNNAASVSWFLNQIISDLYNSILESHPDSQKHQRILRLNASLKPLNETCHANGHTVSFGVIDREFLPSWAG